MRFKNQFNPSSGFRVALLAGTALLAIPTDAFAQQAQPTAQPDATRAEGDEIVVTGTRRSIADALEIKRRSTEIVDSLSSEGIDRLPGLNLAESLQRIPGVQINRSAIRRQGTISIRGLTAPFILTQLNGQILASPGGTTFPFGIVRSEVFNSIDVVKAESASSMSGGLGGIVNLKTNAVIGAKNSLIATVNGRFEGLSKSLEPGGAIVLSHQIVPGNLAVRAALGYQKLDFREDNLTVNNYLQLAGGGTSDTSDDVFAPRNIRFGTSHVTGYNLTGTIDLAWKPTSTLKVDLSYFYDRYRPDAYQLLDQFTSTTGTVVTGTGKLIDQGSIGKTYSGVNMVNPNLIIDSRIISDKQQSQAWNANVGWENDGWSVGVVGHYTKAFLDSTALGFDNESGPTPGLGYVAAFDTGSGNLGRASYSITGNPRFLNFEQPFTAPAIGQSYREVYPVTGLKQIFSGSYRYQHKTDKEKAFEVNIGRDLDLFLFKDVQVGGVFRDKTQTNRGAIGTLYGTNIAALNNSVYNYDTFGGGQSYLQGQAGVPAFALQQLDVYKIRNLIATNVSTTGAPAGGFDASRFFVGSDGLVNFIDASAANSYYLNRQKIYGGYALTNLDYDLGAVRLRGNVGVRYERNDRDTLSGLNPNHLKFSFDNWLPSAIVILDLPHNIVLRGSYTKTVRRPEPDQYSILRTVSTDAAGDSVSINIGAANLKPFTSDNLDLSFEWYNDTGSSISLGLFQKSVKDYAATTVSCPADGGGFGFGPLVLSGGICQTAQATPGHQNADGIFPTVKQGAPVRISTQANQDKFKIKGLELNIQQAFTFLPGALANLGGQFNYTYVKPTYTANTFRLTELSKNTLNLIGYYEDKLFGLRAAYVYRSGYSTDNAGVSLATASLTKGRGQLDLSGYINVNDRMKVTTEAINVTNANLYQYQGVQERSRNYLVYGRTYNLGVSYRF